MRPIHQYLQTSALLLSATVLSMGFSCGDGDGTGCATQADNAWANHIDFTVTEPPRCPIPVSYSGEYKTAAVDFTAYADRLASDRVIMNILDALNISIQVAEAEWVVDPGDPDLMNASASAGYVAGMWRMEYEEDNRDTILLYTEIYSPTTGQVFAFAGVNLPYTFVVDASVAGPPSVHVGEWATMTVTPGNTYAPSYAWRRNGVPIGETSSQHSLVTPYPTTYTFEITVTDGDGDVGVATHFLQILPYTASVSGYAEVQPYATCTWSANTDLPSPPYEYSWGVDGVPQSTSEYFTYAAGTSGFEIAVQITNSLGQSAWGLLSVSVGSWAQECLDT